MERSQMYKLIIGQLKSDGYHSIGTASSVERDALAQVLCSKKGAVSRLRKRARPSGNGGGVFAGEGELIGDLETDPDTFLEFNDRGVSTREGAGDAKSGLDTKFITTHKKFVRCARFSPDGAWVATGSEDTSIKVLDVE